MWEWDLCASAPAPPQVTGLESSVAPYKVFVLATEDKASTEVLPLQDVYLENLHLVCRNAVSWWRNPYVIHFLYIVP